jgi:glycosyltransferase involved in cell wall biosynthesis
MSDYASACMLSFNRRELLARALESVVTEAGVPFELIVHDDGSSDEMVRERLADRVASGGMSTLILNPVGHNQGQGVALNRLFSVASGDPIVKLDHDLTFRPGWLARTVELMRAAPRIGLLGLMHYDHDPVDSAKTLIADHDGWSEHTHILGSAFAVRRECWEALGPFERHSESFSEDWAFQRAVTASRWCCALPGTSLVENHGMGYGPSTVNVSEGVVQGIHTNPHLV